jgi:hypothetical protein
MKVLDLKMLFQFYIHQRRHRHQYYIRHHHRQQQQESQQKRQVRLLSIRRLLGLLHQF